jgi:hypothetical protein
MSSISFQASADFHSDSKEPGCEQSHSARSKNIRAPSLQGTGLPSPDMTMCEILPLTVLEQTELFPISSVAAFPSKMPALPKQAALSKSAEMVSTESEPACLSISSVWPLTFHAPSSSWKMSQASLVLGLDLFSGTWPRSGVMRSGVAFLHSRPACPIAATASGLLPTPAARDYRDLSKGEAYLSARRRHSPSLATKLLELGVHWTAIGTAYELAMGYPSQWSVAELSHAATPSSRKCRKPSGEPS